jgi:hypothetical protein
MNRECSDGRRSIEERRALDAARAPPLYIIGLPGLFGSGFDLK